LIDRNIIQVTNELSSSLRRTLTEYMPKSHSTIPANLAAKFVAIHEFCSMELVAPANFGWSFACLTQVIWDQVATDFKSEMGMAGQTDWTVHHAVNVDLEALIEAAVGPSRAENRNRLRSYKVCSIFWLGLIVSAVLKQF
jgi:hypothetical protein